jgi:hypothetical protein
MKFAFLDNLRHSENRLIKDLGDPLILPSKRLAFLQKVLQDYIMWPVEKWAKSSACVARNWSERCAGAFVYTPACRLARLTELRRPYCFHTCRGRYAIASRDHLAHESIRYCGEVKRCSAIDSFSERWNILNIYTNVLRIGVVED